MIERLTGFQKNDSNPIQSQQHILMFRILGTIYVKSGTDKKQVGTIFSSPLHGDILTTRQDRVIFAKLF